MSSIFNLFRSSSASDFSLPYARKTADWNIVLWLLVPAWLLFWLWTNPPHGFDLAFEHQFYVNNAWPLHADGRIEFWLHFMPKVISGVLFACVLGALTYLHQCRRAAVILGDHEDAAHCNLILSRLYYAVGAALLCVGLLWWLKQSTGVSCPWSVTEFGGSAAVADPGLPFLPKPGRCWPSGAAGSGFCLLPLYFAFRDFRPRLARLLLALALLSGFGAGFARVVVGAHFPSHVFAALALDWLISAGIYIAAFDRAGLVRKLRALLPFGRRSTEDQPGRVTLYLFTSLWWAIVFNGPMTAKLAIDNNLVTTDSLILSLGTTAAFAFVSAAIIELCGLLPKMVFRILLLILNTLGAAAFAAAYLYGTATTPNPQDCPNGECGDRVFLSELKGELGKLPADRPTVLFLHMMGSHGPAYSLRSDKARKLFEPECTDADLKSCSRESVMNAYDNSVRETDYVLASLIRMLKDTSGSIDSALVYVSDHGESLGEGGLYLHGAPYWMAPKEQTEVPMVLWMNSGFEKTFGINRSKLEKNAAGRVTHENLYHTVLGLLNVKSTTYVPTYDLTH